MNGAEVRRWIAAQAQARVKTFDMDMAAHCVAATGPAVSHHHQSTPI